MRITEDRYVQDRQRIDLALRMIHHEARTTTIRQWTGLSDDRIRKLFHTYVKTHSQRIRRRRGKAPTQTSFLLKNAAHRRQAATLASLYTLLGLLPAERSADERPDVSRGLKFCRTYETYLALGPSAPLSFEHAWWLLEVLHRRRELHLQSCPTCQSLMVVDPLRSWNSLCGWCDPKLKDRANEVIEAS
jgi:hypothetical protein